MLTQNKQTEKTIKAEKIKISLNHLVKENVTANKLKKQIAANKRKATNEAAAILSKEIKEDLSSLPIIRQIFKDKQHVKNKEGKIIAKGTSTIFCEALSEELGKVITVDNVLKIPVAKYMDYVKEAEAARQFKRGIYPKEFNDIIKRYYRNEKQSNNMNKEAKNVVLNIIKRSGNI